MRQEVVSRSTSYVRSFFFFNREIWKSIGIGNRFQQKEFDGIRRSFQGIGIMVLKERRLVPRNAVYDGMLRFSFLLETCQPGSVPDHYLMAAILDLVKNILFLKHIYLDRRFLEKFLKTLKLSILTHDESIVFSWSW